MNRKKKINQELKKRQKRANAKQRHSNKPKYISKAERAKLELNSPTPSQPDNGPLDASATSENPTETNSHLAQ
ncbi:DUF2986 domain-containing protein [Motilimonas eburnea]|uniref:DUF2986 domain-containing protein n=1 Tax=Motilimonas eburnea TaxID=1737488 RepID=UPI001E2991AB|nr:DUF2986 domain-containing protein [Motilimonas eburnea]MCE2570519.1 DUF2986 domain-containing protein [Motilimonas eburnea]